MAFNAAGLEGDAQVTGAWSLLGVARNRERREQGQGEEKRGGRTSR